MQMLFPSRQPFKLWLARSGAAHPRFRRHLPLSPAGQGRDSTRANGTGQLLLDETGHVLRLFSDRWITYSNRDRHNPQTDLSAV